MADWFELNGKKSTEYGVHVSTFPSIILPGERVQTYQVPGRHGDLEIRENAYSTIILTFECVSKNIDHMDEFSGMLRQRGWLRMGNYPEFAYWARMISQIDVDQVRKGRQNRAFSILFDCQPFRYIWPEPEAIVTSVSDYPTGSRSILNPGNVESKPKFVFRGSGEFTVTVGMTLMTFRDVEGGIVVDSKAEDCFNLDENMLENDKVEIGDSDFPKLQPGANMISWSGDIESITIYPRWRNV